jgi:hypothetical protein
MQILIDQAWDGERCFSLTSSQGMLLLWSAGSKGPKSHCLVCAFLVVVVGGDGYIRVVSMLISRMLLKRSTNDLGSDNFKPFLEMLYKNKEAWYLV